MLVSGQVPLIKRKIHSRFVFNGMAGTATVSTNKESDDDPVFKVISDCNRDWL